MRLVTDDSNSGSEQMLALIICWNGSEELDGMDEMVVD